MQLDINFLTIIDVLSASTAFMLGLLFLTARSKNSKANIYLGLFLWSLLFEVVMALSQSLSEELYGLPITNLFTMPLLLLYINQTIGNVFKKWFGILFIPGLLLNIFPIIEIDAFRIVEYIFNGFILIYILIILKRHKEKINQFYSDIAYKTLSWIRTIVYIYIGFHIFWITEDLIGFQNEDIASYFAMASTILTFFMIYWIGYNGFSQHEIFKQKLFVYGESESNTPEVFSEKELQKFEQIKKTIEEQKLFTNPKLNLRILAEALIIKEKELSRLINQYAKMNFYQFINRFRVAEFKKLAHSPKAKKLSILGLAEEAGFSSKSTFYTTFKTLEGITPKVYESNIKKSDWKQ